LLWFIAMTLMPAVQVPARAQQVYGAIGDKWTQLGREGGPLGAAVTSEADSPHGGRFNQFQHGYIYWHPHTGAFGVWGAIGVKYQEVGAAQYGYPITDESGTPDGRGRYNHFRTLQLPGAPEASIYWTPETGAHSIVGAIRQKWAEMGWEGSPLRYPVSDEMDAGHGGRATHFEGGSIFWHPATGPHVVWGEIGRLYAELGSTNFGYPITDELQTPNGRGRFNHFRPVHVPGGTDASIYWTPETGAHALWGAIREKWAALGWEAGPLGFPVSSEGDSPRGGRVSRFEAGAIYWHPQVGAFGVWGEIGRRYHELGGVDSALGFPVSDEYQEGVFRRSDFQGGFIRWSADSGPDVFINTRGLSLRFHSIRCVEEVNEESAAEEPYVILTIVDLRSPLPQVPALPNVMVRRYGVWEHFDGGDVVVDSGPPFWGPDGAGQDLGNPTDLAIIVSLVENDNAEPGAYDELARLSATSALAGSIGQTNPGVRAVQVANAIRNAFDGIDLPVAPFPFELDDDHVETQLLLLDASDLTMTGRRDRTISIRNGQGSYDLTIRIERFQ
jgi:uncharacterized protein with LGFP repeats